MFGRASKKSDNTVYYEILGVSKNVSQDDLWKAYKKAAIKNDPDKGGDPEKFLELSLAYEVLCDPLKHQTYNQYDEDALKEGMGANGAGTSSQGGSSGGQRQGRGDDVVHHLDVPLENFFHGIIKEFSLSRTVLCSKCNSKGFKCAGCQGTGIKSTIERSFGIQQLQRACNECKGTGVTISDRDRCPQCNGEKVVQEKKLLHLYVEMGMKNGQKFTFTGEADEAPDTVTGDVVFVLQEKEHPKFKRKGDDLFVKHTLSLTEALCGFQFALTHLDGRQLPIKSHPGQVVKPGSYMEINGEGMPMYQMSFMKGKLYIHFTVEFPDFLTPEQVGVLEGVLSPRPSTQVTDMELDEEVHDKDEDMHGGAQRVQCAQQ